jgi:hypothetical protein
MRSMSTGIALVKRTSKLRVRLGTLRGECNVFLYPNFSNFLISIPAGWIHNLAIRYRILKLNKFTTKRSFGQEYLDYKKKAYYVAKANFD